MTLPRKPKAWREGGTKVGGGWGLRLGGGWDKGGWGLGLKSGWGLGQRWVGVGTQVNICSPATDRYARGLFE